MGSYQKEPQKGITKLQYFLRGSFVLFLFQFTIEATNNLIKRNAFGFRNFENFKKRIFIALNIKKERTKFVLSRS